MNKLRFIVSVLLVACVATGYAQRRNRHGYKIVKSMSLRWYEKDGTYMPSISSDYSFGYDESGNLISAIQKYTDGGDVYTDNYKKEGDKITITARKNGKIRSDISYELEVERGGKIRFRKEIYTVYDGNVIAFKEMNISHYGRDGITRRVFRMFDEEDYQKRMVYDPPAQSTPVQLIADRTWDLLTNEEKEWGLRNYYSVYITKDKKVLRPENKYFTPLVSWGGNLYADRIRNEEELKFMLKKTIHSEKLNDTNINFYGFSSQGLRNPFWKPDLMTEWGPYRSKNLILKEGVVGKRSDGSPNEKQSWDYSYDSHNNITEIKIIDKYGFNRYCIVKIEYLY